ncbi:hypothetical protein [Halomonas urumqiensis]|uniref:C4-dicarboxylate ABC transporter n=1 Tax=Halomonas urumqiensis TaxID=1684789 RepID=A0A2N7ULV5_9GAMM|nr:hypothetical protein [Halomonas urumqiensis]PMR81413.1 hypothetical protein C1H70_05640 [Halomonas urumqiensis]PTB01213.1 hypothetical protein C6V82_16690 [Halomonas urumqiensis]GHE22791.1 hypothetical protein GCM10017767_33120 [Halomonas urumqiensis]
MSGGRLRACLLLVVTLATLADLVFASLLAQWLAMLALGGYLLSLRGLSSMARILLVVAFMLSLVALWQHDEPLVLLHEAAGRFAFFATFLVALGLLRLPAYRSTLVKRCGHTMLLQPPSRRYPILSLGSALFGIILNIGVLNLFAAMIEKSNTLAAAQGRLWVQQARRRRMMLALLRGFALAPLVSPMGIGMAVVLSSMEGLRWIELAPYALGAALLLFLVGWGVDRLTGPRLQSSRQHDIPPLQPLVRFCLLLVSLVALIFSLAWVGGLRLPTAVLLGAPLGAFLWLCWQGRRHGLAGIPSAAVTMHRGLPRLVAPASNEIVVLGAAGYLGHICVGLVEGTALAERVGFLSALGAGTAVVAMLLVALLAQVGINPIVSVTLLVGILPTLGIEGLTPPILAVSLLVGWTLALMSSPMTVSMLILSRFTGVSSLRIGYRWNGLFLCLATPLLAAWFLIARF